MIENTTIDKLLRSETLSDEEWPEILAERERRIRSRLKQIAVVTLGDVRYCAPGVDFTFHGYVESANECRGAENLQMRGIFGVTRYRDKAMDFKKFLAYGMTLEGNWIYAELDTSDKYFDVFTVHPLAIPDGFAQLDLTYRRLYNLLGRAVEAWMRLREKRFKQALALHHEFQLERDLIDQLDSKSKND